MIKDGAKNLGVNRANLDQNLKKKIFNRITTFDIHSFFQTGNIKCLKLVVENLVSKNKKNFINCK